MRSHERLSKAAVSALILALLITVVMNLSPSSHSALASQDGAQPPPTWSCDKVLVTFRVLQDEMLTLDRTLDERVAMMQSATEADRLEAIECVIEEMVIQRRLVLDRMKDSHQKLILHLMQHLQQGEDLNACPLMSYMHAKSPPAPSTGPGDPGDIDR